MTTNVLIGGQLPGLLREVVSKVVESGNDIYVSVIEDGVSEFSRLREYITSSPVDVVIVGCEPSAMEHIGQELLRTKCGLTVVTVSTNGKTGTLFTHVPVSTPLGELSPQTLLDVIHGQNTATLKHHVKH